MSLKDEWKASLTICNNTSVINDQLYKNLLETCFAELCRETDKLNIGSLCVSKPDIIKELHATFLAVIADFGRLNVNSELINNLLTNDCNFTASRSKTFCDLYEKYKAKLQIILGNIGTHLPNIIDVKWKMDHLVKSSDVNVVEGPIFRISLIVEVYDQENKCNKLDTIDFSCTSQELHDIVYKLRDAMRHCMKIATER